MKPKKTHKNGATPKKRMPKWKRHTDDYRADQLSRVRFATADDIDEAIGIVWGGQLHGMPFGLGGDGMSLIIPKDGIPYFGDAGLKFLEVPLSSNTDQDERPIEKAATMKKNASHSNGTQPRLRLPKWKSHVEDYRSDELSQLNFSSPSDIEKALELAWVGDLIGMPFEFGGAVDSLVVPKVSVPYFSKKGLIFKGKMVAS